MANLAGIKENYQIMGHNYDLYIMSMSQEIWEDMKGVEFNKNMQQVRLYSKQGERIICCKSCSVSVMVCFKNG